MECAADHMVEDTWVRAASAIKTTRCNAQPIECICGPQGLRPGTHKPSKELAQQTGRGLVQLARVDQPAKAEPGMQRSIACPAKDRCPGLSPRHTHARWY